MKRNRNKLIRHRLSLIAVFALVSSTASPESVKYEFDTWHTRIMFTINHFGFADMPGIFHEYAGSFIFDQEQPENSSVEIVIASSSIDMFNEPLNGKLLGEGFLNVEAHPEIRFSSTSVEVIGVDRFRIIGDMTLNGISGKQSFDVRLNRIGKDLRGRSIIGFSGNGSIDRLDYGVDILAPIQGTRVDVRLEVEGVRVVE